jgi:hypothetical protein
VADRLIEVLTFDGCPHAHSALALVERVLQDLAIEATVRRSTFPIPTRP